MNFIFKKVKNSDYYEINKFLINHKNDFKPKLSDSEINQEIRELNNNTKWAVIALNNTQIVGYASFTSYQKNKNCAYFSLLVVDKHFRKQNIAKQLATRVLRSARKKYNSIYYTTWSENKKLISLAVQFKGKIVKTYLDEKFRGKGKKTTLGRIDFSK